MTWGMGKINADDLIKRLTEEARILGDSRVIRDDQELTPELSKLIIERFQAFLKRAEKTMASAARSLGIAESTLSQVASGSYGADPEKMLRSIDKWIEQQIAKETAPKPAGFIRDIGIARCLTAVAKYAREMETIVLAYGPAGLGKSISAQAIRAETPGSVYIQIATAGQTKLSVLEVLAQALRLGGLKLTAWQLYQQIVALLHNTGRLVIVDEIHKLEGRRKDEALHVLRDLFDATGCPMLWLGQPNIALYIQRGKSSGYEPLDQVYSRIGLWLDLSEPDEGASGGGGYYTIEDLRKIVAGTQLRITPDGVRYLQMLANEVGAGGLRTVRELLKAVARYAEKVGEGHALDAQVLRAIQAKRIGQRAFADLDARIQMRTLAAG